jgi:hypothetical protein
LKKDIVFNIKKWVIPATFIGSILSKTCSNLEVSWISVYIILQEFKINYVCKVSQRFVSRLHIEQCISWKRNPIKIYVFFLGNSISFKSFVYENIFLFSNISQSFISSSSLLNEKKDFYNLNFLSFFFSTLDILHENYLPKFPL